MDVKYFLNVVILTKKKQKQKKGYQLNENKQQHVLLKYFLCSSKNYQHINRYKESLLTAISF